MIAIAILYKEMGKSQGYLIVSGRFFDSALHKRRNVVECKENMY